MVTRLVSSLLIGFIIHSLTYAQEESERPARRPLLTEERRAELKERFKERREKMRSAQSEKGGEIQSHRESFQAKLHDQRFPKMLELAKLNDQELDQALERWGGERQISPEQREKIKQRLQTFRQRLQQESAESAQELGIDVPEGKQAEFTRAYWQERIKVEQQLREEMHQRRQELMQQAKERVQENISKAQ